MNWRKAAEEDLRYLRRQKESLENLRERMLAMDLRSKSIRGSLSDASPVQGGGSHYEDAMLDSIVERERLRHTYRAVNHLVRLTERGLDGLDARERRVLECFYVDRVAGHVEALKAELGYEDRQVYNLKDRALYKYTISQYGLVDF